MLVECLVKYGGDAVAVIDRLLTGTLDPELQEKLALQDDWAVATPRRPAKEEVSCVTPTNRKTRRESTDSTRKDQGHTRVVENEMEKMR